MPKGAELPAISEEVLNRIDYDEEELKARALAKISQKKLFLTQKPPRKEQAEQEELEKKSKNMSVEEQDAELEKLYQQVEEEIEERQRYLESIAHLDEPKLKERIKAEIIERISELEKIIRMLHKNHLLDA